MTKTYRMGYAFAVQAIKIRLVNGTEEFRTLPIFINSITRSVEVPQSVDPKQFYEGVIDACSQSWRIAREEEAKAISEERKTIMDEYKSRLENKSKN